MRGLVAKIFVSSVLVQVLTRASLVAVVALWAEPHPGPGRQLQQLLPLYAELAATTLEQGGPQALTALTHRLETERGLTLKLLVDAPTCATNPDEPTLTWSSAITHGATRYCLLAAPPDTLGRSWRWTELILLPELALCGVFSFFLARYLLQPIRKISNAAQALGRGDLSARAGPRLGRRRDEAGELVRQFDRMADRIALLIEAQQRFIGDVSHEIKSPLARISMALGLARREACGQATLRFDRMEREIETISQLITELLTLSSLQAAGVTRAFVPLDLAALLQAVIDDAAFEHPGRPVHLVTTEAAMPVAGDAVLLRRAIENVLRNALFYTPPGTAVAIAIDRLPNGQVSVTICDHGPGVPNDALAHLFEPFYRTDEARARNTGGIGIGLAICDRAIRLHGGTVTATNLIPTGLAIQVVLPARHPRPAITMIPPAYALPAATPA